MKRIMLALLVGASVAACDEHDRGSVMHPFGWGPATNTRDRDLNGDGVISVAEAEATWPK